MRWNSPCAVAEVPPRMEVGEIDMVYADAGVSVSVHVLEFVGDVAVTVTTRVPSTPEVVTGNVAVVAPAATVTDAGTLTLVLPLLRLMAVPPLGAGADRVTVPPVGLSPPMMELGEMLTLASPTGVTVSVAVTDLPPAVAVIVTV